MVFWPPLAIHLQLVARTWLAISEHPYSLKTSQCKRHDLHQYLRRCGHPTATSPPQHRARAESGHSVAERPRSQFSAAVLGIDVGTKSWASATLTEPVRLADWLYLMLHHNSGLFLGAVPVSAGYWVCVCVATVWFGWRAWRSTSAATAVCLAVVLAGLTGNAIGQAQGAVVDFIGFGPIWGDLWLFVNVADLAMVLGVLALAFVLVSRMACRARVP